MSIRRAISFAIVVTIGIGHDSLAGEPSIGDSAEWTLPSDESVAWGAPFAPCVTKHSFCRAYVRPDIPSGIKAYSEAFERGAVIEVLLPHRGFLVHSRDALEFGRSWVRVQLDSWTPKGESTRQLGWVRREDLVFAYAFQPVMDCWPLSHMSFPDSVEADDILVDVDGRFSDMPRRETGEVDGSNRGRIYGDPTGTMFELRYDGKFQYEPKGYFVGRPDAGLSDVAESSKRAAFELKGCGSTRSLFVKRLVK